MRGIIWTDLEVKEFNSERELQLLLSANIGMDLCSFSNPEAEGFGMEKTRNQVPKWCLGNDCNFIALFSSGVVVIPNVSESDGSLELFSEETRNILGMLMRNDLGWNYKEYKNVNPKYVMSLSNMTTIIDTLQHDRIRMLQPSHLVSDKGLSPSVEALFKKGHTTGPIKEVKA